MTTFSIALQSDKPLDQYGPIGRRVEELGFDVISVYNDLLYQPAWPALFEIGRQTSHICLGPAAVNPFTSHPVNIAGYSALLDQQTNGRSYLGLARGAWLDYLGLKPSKPLSALREAFACVDHLLRQQRDPLVGDYFPLAGGDSLRWDIFRQNIPKLLGSWGLRTLRYCYPYINEVKLGGCANPDMVKHFSKQRNEIRKRLKQHHSVDIVVGAVTVIDMDGERARDLARREVALYLPVVSSLDSTVSISEELTEGIRSAAEVHDYEAVATYIDDVLLSKFAIAGTPQEITEQCRNLVTAGASRIEFGTPHGLFPERGLELLGQQVLPELKQSGA